MIDKISTYWHWYKNYINIFYWKFLFLFGINRSEKPIPPGMYCYEADIEKNKHSKTRNIFYIKPCKYYKALGKHHNGCSFLGIVTDDPVFDDQCKMCDVNNEYESDEEILRKERISKIKNLKL